MNQIFLANLQSPTHGSVSQWHQIYASQPQAGLWNFLPQILSRSCLHLPRLLVTSLLFKGFITGWHPASFFGFPFLPSLSFSMMAWWSKPGSGPGCPSLESRRWSLLDSVTMGTFHNISLSKLRLQQELPYKRLVKNVSSQQSIEKSTQQIINKCPAKCICYFYYCIQVMTV